MACCPAELENGTWSKRAASFGKSTAAGPCWSNRWPIRPVTIGAVRPRPRRLRALPTTIFNIPLLFISKLSTVSPRRSLPAASAESGFFSRGVSHHVSGRIPCPRASFREGGDGKFEGGVNPCTAEGNSISRSWQARALRGDGCRSRKRACRETGRRTRRCLSFPSPRPGFLQVCCRISGHEAAGLFLRSLRRPQLLAEEALTTRRGRGAGSLAASADGRNAPWGDHGPANLGAAMMVLSLAMALRRLANGRRCCLLRSAGPRSFRSFRGKNVAEWGLMLVDLLRKSDIVWSGMGWAPVPGVNLCRSSPTPSAEWRRAPASASAQRQERGSRCQCHGQVKSRR